MKRYLSFSSIKNTPFHWTFLPIFLIVTLSEVSCKKLVHIDPPTASIVTAQVFGDSTDALSAMEGLYSSIANSSYGTGFSVGASTSADDLLIFASSNGNTADRQMYNVLDAHQDGYPIDGSYWGGSYGLIYKANAIIEGMRDSKGVSARQKVEYTGEALFFRAFLHFYLVNLFGPVPIITTADYRTNTTVTRNSVGDVYKQIINDLSAAKNMLSNDYSAVPGERIRVNKWAASALLARAYLFNQQWDSAAAMATSVISNTALYNLNPDLNSVFLINNSEAILQWNLNTSQYPYNAIKESLDVIPLDSISSPNVYINQQLYAAFEPGDNRKVSWLGHTKYGGTIYYYPFKYKIGPAQKKPGASATEYYMVLRLAEQYLIRAEARVNKANPDLAGAAADLNLIRERAGLADLPSSLPQADMLTAVLQERRVELFCEWGHRWLDLKRTGTVDAVMAVATPLKNGGTAWKSFQQWYPIPFPEIQKSPYLTQNQGY